MWSLTSDPALPRDVARWSLICLLTACGTETVRDTTSAMDSVRVATFNVQELSASKLAQVDSAGVGADSQLIAAAGVIRRVRPDILLLNEVDYLDDDPLRAARLFLERYLAVGGASITYPYQYAAPTNTGILSGLDLDRNGVTADSALLGDRAYGDDSWGFGVYPGQYGMAILSRYPIDTAAVRTFRLFRWQQLPRHHMPVEFWPDSVATEVRLSSKSHWDVPVLIGSDTLHLLASHPTPPVFDGPEDRNGRRNFDEIGFWKHYLDNDSALVDDRGQHGGLAVGNRFVILGDLNADPERGDSTYDGVPAMAQLLGHPLVQEPVQHRGVNTASFLGGTRVDFTLVHKDLEVRDAGVFNPDSSLDAHGAALARTASDHRMAWVDLRWPPQ